MLQGIVRVQTPRNTAQPRQALRGAQFLDAHVLKKYLERLSICAARSQIGEVVDSARRVLIKFPEEELFDVSV
jgi:hypothetical protein